MSHVSFIKTQNDEDSIKEAIIESLNLIKYNFRRNIDEIVIKPNMCYYHHPSTGEVTDPAFVGIVIDILNTYFDHPKISIVESDASAMKCKYVFRILGYDKLAEEKKVNLINLTESEHQKIQIDLNNKKYTLFIPEIFKQNNLIINIPKIKYMKQVLISCALKNMFGCNAYPRKYIYHKSLNEIIVKINEMIRTDLSIIDAITVKGNSTKKMNYIISSEDLVALDSAVSLAMGFNPRTVEHISLASKTNLGNTDFIPLGDYDTFLKEFPKKRFSDKLREAIAPVYTKIMT